MPNSEDKVTNEVIINGEVELSTRKNTVTENTLGQDETAQDKTGHSIVGNMEDGSKAYKPTDPISSNITDEDYIPFYDVSEQKKHNTLFSKIIDRLKGVFLEKSNNPNTNISLGGQTINLKMNNIDASMANNNVTSNQYPSTANILDRKNRTITRFESVVNPNGKIGAKIYVQNYNTEGERLAQKGIQWHMDKSGNLTYQIDDYNAFRNAIKTVDQVGVTIPNESNFDNYKTAGTYAVTSDASAQTMFNIPIALCGKLIVSNNGNGGYTQFYVQNQDAKVFIRAFWNNAWSAWSEIGSGGGGTHTYQEGTAIPSNSDFNSYTTAGVYKVATDAIAQTLSHSPCNNAGKLIVYAGVGSEVEQVYMDTDNDEYSRVYDGSAWGDWKKGGSGGSVIFDDTTTVFDEDGDGLLHTYETGLTIPSGSDLNDYTEAGVYRIAPDATASAIDNCPVAKAGKLIVIVGLASDGNLDKYIKQLYLSSVGETYERNMINATWRDWKQYSSTSDITSIGQNYFHYLSQPTNQITANQDLNDYTTSGTYQCNNANIAVTLSNCPVSHSFKLIVDRAYTRSQSEIMQRITLVHDGDFREWIRLRGYNSSTWLDWKQYSTGKHTYELGLRIPADSDLNDYKTEGSYYIKMDSDAADIANTPENVAGKVIVTATSDANGYIRQTFIRNNGYAEYNRFYNPNNSTWSSWQQLSTGKHTYELGTDIPANSDLNTYTTEGVYRIAPDATAITITNIPQGTAGKLIIVKGVASDGNVDKYKEQFYLTYTGNIYKRYTTNSGSSWSEWTKMATTSDITPAQVGNGYAVATVSGSTITATIDGFQLRAGVIVTLSMSVSIPVEATLNISSTGAKSIYWWNNNTALRTCDVPHLVNGGMHTFMYTGSVYLFISSQRTPLIGAQSYVADTSGSLVETVGIAENAYQIKYNLGLDKLRWNYYKNSVWRGDVNIADYDDIVHQTLGTDITDNANLDSYTTNGIYNVNSNTRAATITNIPYPYMGKLIVMRIGTSDYISQFYITYGVDALTAQGIYRRIYNGSNWGGWVSFVTTGIGNSFISLYCETTTADDLPVGIEANIKDTTTGKSYTYKVMKVYQDHHASPYGLDLLLGAGGNTIINGGDTATQLYNLIKDGADERLFLTADNEIYIESNANTIANRKGFMLNNNHELIPVLAEVATNNVGSIGNATYKLANVYTNNINGVDASSITGAASDAIISNKSYSTAITSLNDVPINTAGLLNLDAATSPINLAGNYIYICYGKDNQKTIELTRMNHGNKNTEERWYNAYNGSSWTGWMPLSRTGTYVGTCTTAADQQKKVATVDGDFSLKKGVRVAIKFTNTNTFSSQTSTPITLNVNSTGDKNIYAGTTHSGAGNTGTNTTAYGQANYYHYYVYDGTYWVWDGRSWDNNTTYTPQSLGIGYGTNTEAESVTARAVTLSSYNLTTNGIIAVKFTNAVPAGATLNVNGKGAKSVYYRGVALKANVIKAGDVATFIYNGSQYHLLGIDRTTAYDDLITGTGTAAQDKGSGVTNRYVPAKWTFDTGRTATAGDIITIKIPVAGHDYGVFVSVDNGTNYIPVALNGTARLTTHFPINQTLQLVYEADTTVNDVYPVAGGDARVNITGVWRVLNYRDNDTTNPPNLGSGYGTCSTAESTTAKVVTLSNYVLKEGGIVAVKFTNAVPASATMNINSRGAKSIYHRGSAITANKIKAGDIALFAYSSNVYHLITVDRLVT